MRSKNKKLLMDEVKERVSKELLGISARQCTTVKDTFRHATPGMRETDLG